MADVEVFDGMMLMRQWQQLLVRMWEVLCRVM
jgi:hypothetical protein